MINVLCLIAHYLPGYKAGGALRSVTNMVKMLTNQCHFQVLTSDHDLGDSHPYPGILQSSWVMVNGTKVYYASKPWLEVFSIVRRSDAEIIYLNSFFDVRFSILPTLTWKLFGCSKTRLIIAPRGEFSKGALQLKWRKKRLFIMLARMSSLYHGVIWHASTQLEAEDIRRTLGSVAKNIRTIQDIVLSTTENIDEKIEILLANKRNPLKLCFISRISPKKNLDYAISVLRNVNIPITFNIYGPIEDSTYIAYCRKLISDLPNWIKIYFHDAVDHSQVGEIFSQHHLFFFPTRGENFGHVIAEALAVGTPVLLSDQTPWLKLQQAGVGWDLTLDEPSAFVDAIHSIAAMDVATYVRMRACAKNYSCGSDAGEAAGQMLALFSGASFRAATTYLSD